MKKQKSLIYIFVLFAVITGSIWQLSVQAAGGLYYVSLQASPNSTTADGSSKITFTTYVYSYRCPNSTVVQAGETCSDGSAPVVTGSSGKTLNLSGGGA